MSGNRYYIDRQSIRRTVNQVRFNLSMLTNTNSDSFDSLLTQYTAGCTNKTYKALGTYAFKGATARKIKGAEMTETAEAGTISDTMITRACAPR